MADLDLHTAGHLIRRALQLHDTIFAQETASYDITSPQLAALKQIEKHPGIEMSALSDLIAYDCATVGGIIDRLEAKRLVRRTVSKRDRRKREVALTALGRALLAEIAPMAKRVQERLLERLSKAERAALVGTLSRVVNVEAKAPGSEEVA
jgi:DNA-binding MarR family transcriptional regulator